MLVNITIVPCSRFWYIELVNLQCIDYNQYFEMLVNLTVLVMNSFLHFYISLTVICVCNLFFRFFRFGHLFFRFGHLEFLSRNPKASQIVPGSSSLTDTHVCRQLRVQSMSTFIANKVAIKAACRVYFIFVFFWCVHVFLLSFLLILILARSFKAVLGA